MISVCSNCNQVLGDKEPLDNTSSSHGFCLYCLCIWYVKAGIIGSSLNSAMKSAAKIKGCRPVRLLSYGSAK
jgi:hypothetical protein